MQKLLLVYFIIQKIAPQAKSGKYFQICFFPRFGGGGGGDGGVLSMRMQVILDSSFACPGSAPIWGGERAERGTGLHGQHVLFFELTIIVNRPFYSCVLSYLAMNASEVGVELALIQTSLFFSCKCKLVRIRTT